MAVAAFCSAPATARLDSPHYAIGASLVPERNLIAVDAIISLPEGTDEAEFVLGGSYDVISAEAGAGASVSIEDTAKPWRGLQRIAVRFNGEDPAPRLRVRYAGGLSPSGEPPLNMVTPELMELNLDSMWLPIRSDLGGYFTAEARIGGIPQDAIVVSQGTATRSGDEVRISRTFPDIDLAFVAAPALQRVSAGDFELFARDPGNEHGRLYLKHGTASIRFLEKWLGPMPGKPARLVVVSRPRVSGYARKGYIVFTEGAKGSERGTAKFTAHEFAHAWFSNANASTEHRWLDESTAEYASLRYVEEAFGKTAFEEMLAAKRKSAATAKPVLTANAGDAALYGKGALILHGLEERIGRDRLDTVLAEVARRNIGDTAEFLAFLSEQTDPATAAWLRAELTR